jgi:hypothetical protein
MSLSNLKISAVVLQKLLHKHKVKLDEIEECFMNRIKGFLVDTRENNATNPPTQWFIAETDKGRKLKIVFIASGSMYEIKTAYAPNSTEVKIYDKHA